MFLFNIVIESILLYAVEIWREQTDIKRIQETYIKWTLNLDRLTSSYVLLEETIWDKIRIKTGARTVKNEKIQMSSKFQQSVGRKMKNIQKHSSEMNDGNVIKEINMEQQKWNEDKWKSWK